MSPKKQRRRPIAQLTSPKNAALAIHAVTASGAIAGMLALQALVDGRIRDSLLWLIVTQILDGIDGPMARRIDVGVHAPQVDGHSLDLVVDYVTNVVVPVALLVGTNLLPTHQEAWIAGLILFTSALWFSRTDLETSDHWFNGFSASWNIAVPTFLILELGKTEIAWISVILCLLQLSKFKMPHLIRVRMLRKVTLPLTLVYFAVLTYLSAQYGEPGFDSARAWGQYFLLGFPGYILALSLYRTFWAKPSRRSRSPRRNAIGTQR